MVCEVPGGSRPSAPLGRERLELPRPCRVPSEVRCSSQGWFYFLLRQSKRLVTIVPAFQNEKINTGQEKAAQTSPLIKRVIRNFYASLRVSEAGERGKRKGSCSVRVAKTLEGNTKISTMLLSEWWGHRDFWCIVCFSISHLLSLPGLLVQRKTSVHSSVHGRQSPLVLKKPVLSFL